MLFAWFSYNFVMLLLGFPTILRCFCLVFLEFFVIFLFSTRAFGSGLLHGFVGVYFLFFGLEMSRIVCIVWLVLLGFSLAPLVVL